MSVRSLARPLALGLALTLVVLASPNIYAKDGALSLVPANAVTVGVVKVSDLRSSPLMGTLFEHTDKMSADGDAQKFLAETGLSVTKDVDLVVVATSPRTTLGSEADIVVLAEGRFQPEKLTSALLSRGAVKKNGYLLLPEGKDDNDRNGAVAFPSASLAIAGTEQAVVAALAARTKGGTGFPTTSNIGGELHRIDTSATAWALVDVTRASRLTRGGHVNTGKGAPGEALAQAIKSVSTMAVWATESGNELKLGAFGVSGDEETLQLLEDTVRGALSAMRLAVKDKKPELVTVLRRFDVERSRDTVTVSGSIPASTLRDMIAKKRASRD